MSILSECLTRSLEESWVALVVGGRKVFEALQTPGQQLEEVIAVTRLREPFSACTQAFVV